MEGWSEPVRELSWFCVHLKFFFKYMHFMISQSILFLLSSVSWCKVSEFSQKVLIILCTFFFITDRYLVLQIWYICILTNNSVNFFLTFRLDLRKSGHEVYKPVNGESSWIYSRCQNNYRENEQLHTRIPHYPTLINNIAFIQYHCMYFAWKLCNLA